MLTPNGLSLIISTVSSADIGSKIAKILIEEQLAACVSLVPEIISTYRWKGAVHESKEILMIIKVVSDRTAALIERLTLLHPYEVPEILQLAPEQVNAAYLKWAMAESIPVE